MSPGVPMRTRKWLFDVVRLTVFNFHSITSVIIAKIKKVDTSDCKIDTGSDDQLMPISMYKMLFLYTKIN